MYIFKRDIPESDKYYYREYEKLFGERSYYNLRDTLLMVKQYYKGEVERLKKCLKKQ